MPLYKIQVPLLVLRALSANEKLYSFRCKDKVLTLYNALNVNHHDSYLMDNYKYRINYKDLGKV